MTVGRAIDARTLVQLRAMVRRLEVSNATGTSLADVVRLAREVRLRSGVTVDFEATAELGQPLVVLRVPDDPGSVVGLETLAPRELEVAGLIAAGLSNKQIASQLRLSLGTVKQYVHQILRKTGLPGRVAIATNHRPRG